MCGSDLRTAMLSQIHVVEDRGQFGGKILSTIPFHLRSIQRFDEYSLLQRERYYATGLKREPLGVPREEAERR